MPYSNLPKGKMIKASLIKIRDSQTVKIHIGTGESHIRLPQALNSPEKSKGRDICICVQTRYGPLLIYKDDDNMQAFLGFRASSDYIAEIEIPEFLLKMALAMPQPKSVIAEIEQEIAEKKAAQNVV